MDTGGCLSDGWSVISSASTSSQLAGLLAGFVFSGVVMLLGRPGARNTKALGLFVSAFVVLGFDSYLYSRLSGEDSDPLCSRVWSQGMVASGMLAVGAVAVINSMCWLLATHLEHATQVELAPRPGQPTPAEHGGAAQQLLVEPTRQTDLHGLARIMVHGAAIAVSLLLAVTSLQFLAVTLENTPAWLMWSVVLSPIVVNTTTLTWDGFRAARHRRRARTAPVTPARSSSTAAGGVLVYGVTGPVAIGLLTNVPIAWSPPAPATVASVLLVAFVAPLALMILLVATAPPLRSPVAHAVRGAADQA
jgi:hypothetical protein